jgi:serine/threonine protein kinase
LRLPTREQLPACTERVLHRGGWANPDVSLIRVDGRPLVLKDFSPRHPLVRATLGRWLMSRERRAYGWLAGLDQVPRLEGTVDALAIVTEYRPGEPLARSLAPSLPVGFLAELETAIAAMHARGVVHLDLRHRSNILADQAGRPVLLDFASALRMRPESLLGRLLLPALKWIDLRALDKWRVRLAPGEG